MARCRRLFYGDTGHNHPQHGCASYIGGTACNPDKYEIRAGELHIEPRRIHPDQRMDGRSVRHTACIRLCHRAFYFRFIPLWHLQRHSSARSLPRFTGMRWRYDGAGLKTHAGESIR